MIYHRPVIPTGPNMSVTGATQRLMDRSLEMGPSVDADAVRMEGVVDRQNLLIQTLLMILLEKQVIYEDEFREWMEYVDELDGKRDGKVEMADQPTVCPGCGRNSAPGRTKCIWCQHELPREFLVRRPEEPED